MMSNLCPVCECPLRRAESRAHRDCWDKYRTIRKEAIKPVNSKYFKEQIQGGFCWDNTSVLI